MTKVITLTPLGEVYPFQIVYWKDPADVNTGLYAITALMNSKEVFIGNDEFEGLVERKDLYHVTI